VNVRLSELCGYVLWALAGLSLWLGGDHSTRVRMGIALLLAIAGSTLIVRAGQERTIERIARTIRIASLPDAPVEQLSSRR
jgi:hypothetical protein